METKYQFIKMSISEFETYISCLRVGRTILSIQQHHTYSPSYILFKGNNHFELQKGMKHHHVVNNGWSDIGQHITTFPDGSVMTGRSIEKAPACIYGNNAHAICIENLGNFDGGGDEMTDLQKESIIRLTAAICSKFNIGITTDKIVYHHWFNLATGERNNGSKNNKSCPGTNFFGGNKVRDCEEKFLPLIRNAISGGTDLASTKPQYFCATTDNLNIRNGPSAAYSIIPEREPLQLGTILRVYDEKNGWFKISNSQQHWCNGKFMKDMVL